MPKIELSQKLPTRGRKIDLKGNDYFFRFTFLSQISFNVVGGIQIGLTKTWNAVKEK